MAKLISYDLRAPGRNYEKLYDAIRTAPDWAKVNESCWIVSSPLTAVQIRDNLRMYIDSNDRLFVVQLENNAAWFNPICEDQAIKRILAKS